MRELSSDRRHCDDLHERLVATFRAHGLETTFFLQAVAERLGVAVTDLACLTILLLEGPATAGHLSRRTGLTTGAITGVIDRLSKGGRARRTVDPADRRRVVVEPVLERAGDVSALLGPMVTDARRLQADFSADQLLAVLRYVSEATRMLADNTERLRSGADSPAAATATMAPGEISAATLYLSGLAGPTKLQTGDTGSELCRVDSGRAPSLVCSPAGCLTIKVQGRPRAAPGDITLSESVTWELEIKGGSSRLEADLCRARLSAVTLEGGANRVHLNLPAPGGVVPVVIAGGASRLVIRRPEGVAAAVTLRGGASDVVVDGHNLRSAGSDTRVGEPLSADACGYQIEVRGGANHIVIDQA